MFTRHTELHLFYAELAKLLEAGFDIRKAAEVMLSTSLPQRQARRLKSMLAGLDAGKSIADSFAGEASDLEISLIEAGERGGRLAQSFRHLADYFRLLASVRAEALRSLIYPLFVLHLGIVAAVVPRALMLGEASFSDLLRKLLWVLLAVYAVGALVAVAVKMLLDAAPRKPALDRCILRIPLIGKARMNLALARFTKVYHASVLAGLPPSASLDLASRAAHSGSLRVATLPLIAMAKDGGQVGPGIMAAREFPGAFARSYATAEESGSLDADMARWSVVFQERAEAAARAVSAVLPKLLYFFILAFVAWQIIGFFSSYYELLDGIGE